ncbi:MULTISPECIES: glycosyltransferase [Micrococcaceae]|uniref:glycosyltransferase n=1 Tax=Micrococcaceae TaxID=1268 RepID=UPI0008A1418A|nr:MULTISPECIES: glycosyltransferase [Micrococcaceae]MCG7304580.1 glycosyltransferase [Pseudoglutamicibacter albus]OFT23671.1 glycosyl transferase family 1 [Arthrobacter sp. HMSC08H08]OFT41588.1 glycosyl transferase family 1 [Arthrobacter sp. HMSC06H05]
MASREMEPALETRETPLRILIACDTYPPDVNGAAVFCYRLASNLTKRGHEVHVLAARSDRGPSFVEHRPEATVHRVTSHKAPTHETYRLVTPLTANKIAGQVMDEIRPDAVHIQCHYMIGHAAQKQATKRGIRLIATNHFMPENLEPFLPFPQWFLNIVSRNSWRDMGKIMGKADVVTTPTPLAARAMRENAGLKHVLPLSNGIDSAHYELRKDETLPQRDYQTVLFAGRLAVEKNIDVLLRAMARLKQHPQPHVRIVGEGEQRPKLEALAKELDIENRVHFLGFVDDETLRQEYLCADVFCQPGTAELQSLVTLEALSASRPVVLADALALPHLVKDGVNGYLFTPGDDQDLAAKLASILDLSPAERAEMGEAGHQLALTHGEEKTISTFEALYRGADVRDYL